MDISDSIKLLRLVKMDGEALDDLYGETWVSEASY